MALAALLVVPLLYLPVVYGLQEPGIGQSTTFAEQPFDLPVSAALNTTISYAYKFTVQYDLWYKIVSDTHAGTTYYLVQSEAPTSSALNAFSNNGSFEIPLTNFGIDATVTGNFLQLLGLTGKLKQALDVPVVDPCLQKVALSLPPTADPRLPLFSASGVGPLDAPNISFSATQDPGVLSRAEWIKYVALFFNKEELAQEVFSKINSSYQCLNGSAPVTDTKPVVAWLSFYKPTDKKTQGVWTLSNTVYKMQYVRDAGGVFTPVALHGSVFYNMELATDVASFHALLESIDVVIDETYLPGGPPQYSIAEFIANAKLNVSQTSSNNFGELLANVWSIYGTYAQDTFATAWFEAAVSQPQIVLQELLAILHPSTFPSGLDHTFFYNVQSGIAKSVTSADCKAADPTGLVPPASVMCPTAPSAAEVFELVV